MTEFRLPELGENINTAEVIRVLVSEGDTIAADQSVLEVESEKAAMPLPSPHAGRIAKVHVREGEQISVGQPLLTIEEAEAEESESGDGRARSNGRKKDDAKPKKTSKAERTKEPPPKQKADEEPADDGKKRDAGDGEKAEIDDDAEKEPGSAEDVDEPQEPASKQRKPPRDRAEEPEVAKEDGKQGVIPAGPATRRFARELGVDLSRVRGSGPGGRITREDVQQAVRDTGGTPVPRLPDFEQWGPVERRKLSAIARTTARHLQSSWQFTPQVTQHGLADITELESRRKQLPPDPKITITAIAIKAAVAVLREFPQVNSSFDAEREELIVKRYIHIGVAVDTKHGLIVPVIRDADRKSIRQIAVELADLAEKARKRALNREQLQGGTFTVTNLGGIGGTSFTPIVNYPEAAILGLSQSQIQLVRRGAEIEDRLMLPLSLSYDHRIINGADGARFVRRLTKLLADPFAMLMGV